MAMEAAESAYLEQLAVDAKVDAAYGYIEPWSMPQSLDEFAGKEGEDGDGGLYGEWHDDSRDDDDRQKRAHSAVSDGAYDDVIHAEPVGGYEQWQEGRVADDDNVDDFYGDGGMQRSVPPPPPRQAGGTSESRGGGGKENTRAANTARLDKRDGGEAETLLHVASESMCVAHLLLLNISPRLCAGENRKL
jgi:hypothetical protein